MNQEDKNKVFDYLIKSGIMRADIHFSGGNDEGGCDVIQAFDVDGKSKTIPEGRAYCQKHWNAETKKMEGDEWFVWETDGSRPATQEEIDETKIVRLLETPIYETYYGFAGDFYVSGILTWNVLEGSVYMERDEEVKDYEHSHLDF